MFVQTKERRRQSKNTRQENCTPFLFRVPNSAWYTCVMCQFSSCPLSMYTLSYLFEGSGTSLPCWCIVEVFTTLPCLMIGKPPPHNHFFIDPALLIEDILSTGSEATCTMHTTGSFILSLMVIIYFPIPLFPDLINSLGHQYLFEFYEIRTAVMPYNIR